MTPLPASDSTFELGTLRTTASHTIAIPHLVDLFAALPTTVSSESYRNAVVEDNILGRPTLTGRQRTFRHLRECYILDPASHVFNVFRYLWSLDRSGRPLLAAVLAVARDEVLRASWTAIERAQPGDLVTSAQLSDAVAVVFGAQMSENTIAKCGRNSGACWTQSGHLEGRARKTRRAVTPAPAAIAFAAYLGHLAGERGANTLNNPWARILDIAQGRETDALSTAHSDGLLDLQFAGSVVAVSFPRLEAVTPGTTL